MLRTPQFRSRNAAASWLLAIAGTVLFSGCGEGPSLPSRVLEARKAHATAPRFVDPKPADEKPSDRTLLLFIHGIFGDTYGTWCHENGACLPKLILDTPEFSGHVDAFVFGYPSSVFQQGSFSLPEAAKMLHTEIQFQKLLQRYPRIVIVAHSLGGLVAIETLTTYPDVAAKVPLVVTYATPYNGAQVAALGRKLLNNPALADMVPVDQNNSLLTSLSNRWKTQRSTQHHATRILCAYEKIPVAPLLGGLIVPETSGVALCDEAADAIAEDHIGIVKPQSVEHASYKVLVNALRSLKDAPAVPQLVDISVLALLAQVPDATVRVKLYKKLTGATDVAPDVLDLISRMQLPEGTQAKFTNPIAEENIADIETPAQLAAFAPTVVAGLPCGGKPEFRIVANMLECVSGQPIPITITPNAGGTLKSYEIIVFHSTSTRSLADTVAQLTSKDLRASAHIVIDRDGSVIQLVPFDQTAWHVGVSHWKEFVNLNSYSIGIDLVNAGQLRKEGELWKTWFDGNVPETGVDTGRADVQWEKYTEAQIIVATAITRALGSAYGIREIAGHCHVSPGRKTDPGPYFPFEEIQSRALGTSTQLPPCGTQS